MLPIVSENENPAVDAEADLGEPVCQFATPVSLAEAQKVSALAPETQLAEAQKGEPRNFKKIFRVVSTFFAVTVCGLAFGFTVQGFVMTMALQKVVGSRDFTVFWATARQLVHHANPYDGVALLQIERSSGLPAQYGVMYMRNLPSALPLVYPLGFLNLWPASIIWSLLLAGCLVLSVHMLWVMNGRHKNSRHYLGYSFGPALVCLIMGQTTVFSLLGLVLFLRFHRSRPFVAGLSLWLCMLKPHLFVPFGLVLIAWIFLTRTYKILAGVALATAVSCGLAYLIDPHAWSQYTLMARNSGVQWEFIPCVAVLLRTWISKQTVWVEYVPTALGCPWALWYFWRRRLTWDWNKDGNLLMLVSLMTAPYSWIYDAGLAIPALLQAAYITRSRSILVIIAFLSSLIEVALFGNVWKEQAIFFWTMWSAPAWLIWYLVASVPPAKWAEVWAAMKGKWNGWFRPVRIASPAQSEPRILQ